MCLDTVPQTCLISGDSHGDGTGLMFDLIYPFPKERHECEARVVSGGDRLLMQSLAGVIALNAALKWRARVCIPVHCLEGVCRTRQNARGGWNISHKIHT